LGNKIEEKRKKAERKGIDKPKEYRNPLGEDGELYIDGGTKLKSKNLINGTNR